MAIDLPPVMPPQLATQSQIEASAQVSEQHIIRAEIAGIAFRVVGNRYLAEAQVIELLDNADSPSAAITELTRQYYNAGHLLVGVRYFRVGDTVTVLVKQNTLGGVRGDKHITSHFRGLVGDSDLQLEEFDRARVLADWRAQRTGVEYSVSFEQYDDQQVILELSPRPAKEYRASEFELAADNRGSRFLGRYFTEAGLTQRFSGGSELGLGYRTALTDLGEAEQGDDYHQLDLTYQRASRWGVYGIAASQLRYRRSLALSQAGDPNLLCSLLGLGCSEPSAQALELEAEVSRLALSGEQVWRSNPARRISFFQQLEYVDSSIETESAGQSLLDEAYASLGLGSRYQWRGVQLGQQAGFSAQLAVQTGLSDSEGSLETVQGDGVAIGKRSADFLLLKPRLAWQLEWPGQWQSQLGFVAQFADDSQLPQQQQWLLGGMDGLSAWLPGVLLGDSGFLLKLAMRRDWQRGEFRLEAGGFVEYGAAWFEDTASELGDRQSASDIGLRLRASHKKNVSSELIVAAPLAKDVQDEARLDQLESNFYWKLNWRF